MISFIKTYFYKRKTQRLIDDFKNIPFEVTNSKKIVGNLHKAWNALEFDHFNIVQLNIIRNIEVRCFTTNIMSLIESIRIQNQSLKQEEDKSSKTLIDKLSIPPNQFTTVEPNTFYLYMSDEDGYGIDEARALNLLKSVILHHKTLLDCDRKTSIIERINEKFYNDVLEITKVIYLILEEDLLK